MLWQINLTKNNTLTEPIFSKIFYNHMKKYAITDIHGCNKTFNQLLDKIAFTTTDQLFLLGDYVDRGPDSSGVIDTILDLQQQGYNIHCLRGNHEQMMIDASDPNAPLSDNTVWLRNGGDRTLRSYYEGPHRSIPDAHFHFLDSLSVCKITEQFVFVHAGLNFDTPNPLDNQYSMLWIRNWYDDLNRHWLGDRIIVHGHTPQKRSRIERQLRKLDDFPVMNIDAGCVFDYVGFGHLCAFDLEQRTLTFVKRVE